MSKKITALVEILMVICLLCTGYSSWLISQPYQATANEGGLEAYAPIVRTMADYGLTLTKSAGNVTAESFSYVTMSTGESTWYEFTNLSLSMLLKVDLSKADQIPDARADDLIVYCQAFSQVSGTTTKVTRPFADVEGNNNRGPNKILDHPTTAKVSLHEYPTITTTVPVTVNELGYLEIRLSMEEIYNMISLYKGSTNTPMLIIHLDFAVKQTTAGADITVSQTDYESLCSTWKYDFWGLMLAQ